MCPADWEIEQSLWQSGFVVAGVDEAGRGPLAGPVVAAAVIFPFGCDLFGLNDSKLLAHSRREELFEIIRQRALAIAWTITHKDIIDTSGIQRATYQSMRQSLKSLSLQPTYALIDGPWLPPSLPCPAQPVVHGDSKSSSIAAASIVAKVVRDRLMVKIHEQYPQYGFAQNKGYATAAHLAALDEYGPCPCHRRSFAPVREIRLQFDEE